MRSNSSRVLSLVLALSGASFAWQTGPAAEQSSRTYQARPPKTDCEIGLVKQLLPFKPLKPVNPERPSPYERFQMAPLVSVGCETKEGSAKTEAEKMATENLQKDLEPPLTDRKSTRLNSRH